MHLLKWAGIILIAVAVLGSAGITFNIIPTFASVVQVLFGIAGTYLAFIHKTRTR